MSKSIISIPPIPTTLPQEAQVYLQSLIEIINRLHKKLNEHEDRLIAGGL